MMSDVLLAAASAGGSALVTAAATEVWSGVRDGVVSLFARAGRRRETAEQWADATAAEIAAASPELMPAVRQRLEVQWQRRLADLVDEHEELGEPLQAWVREVQAQLPVVQRSQTFIVMGKAQQYNAPQGTQTINNYRDR